MDKLSTFSDNNRQFKGIWIPKQIWLNRDLSIMEKVLLVEIDSFERNRGCFANNRYFSEFFGVSMSRISQIINGLHDRGYILIEYLEQKYDQDKRILKLNKRKLDKIVIPDYNNIDEDI